MKNGNQAFIAGDKKKPTRRKLSPVGRDNDDDDVDEDDEEEDDGVIIALCGPRDTYKRVYSRHHRRENEAPTGRAYKALTRVCARGHFLAFYVPPTRAAPKARMKKTRYRSAPNAAAAALFSPPRGI